MRLIDADTLKANINTAFWSGIEKIIDSAPTIDAVEVVRCRDCRWYRDGDGCFFSTAEAELDGYCSYGERKND